MLKRLHLKNFTVFADAQLTFGSGVNILLGENGVGKTHVLKAAYAMIDVLARGAKDAASAPTRALLQPAIGRKLQSVFRPDQLGRLARRQRGVSRAEGSWTFAPAAMNTSITFNTKSTDQVSVTDAPKTWGEKLPVYLPARELLSIYPGFVSLYETTHTEFDETWRDACLLLGAPLAKGPREKRIRELLRPIEEDMGGQVELDAAGRFYLKTGDGRVEMHLIAEGLRKLATIARLIATGSLLDKGYLFWDEPEANMHPKLVRDIAATIMRIARSGVQVFIATHSLFLLREFEILRNADFADIATRFFNLKFAAAGVEVEQADSIDDIHDLSLLDENLTQSERYVKQEAEHEISK